MNVLIACEFSGIVRDAFAAKGHNAWSCDLLPSEREGNHIQGNVFDHLKCVPFQPQFTPWDLLIFHWPCTLLCNSGVRWLYGGKGTVRDEKRFALMYESAFNFKRLLDCGIPRICGENPIPHHFASQIMGQWTQKIQPWQFGHPESKATCLWLKNLPNLTPSNDVKADYEKCHKAIGQRIWYESPGPNRWKNRSRTFTGIAQAMADQWSI